MNPYSNSSSQEKTQNSIFEIRTLGSLHQPKPLYERYAQRRNVILQDSDSEECIPNPSTQLFTQLLGDQQELIKEMQSPLLMNQFRTENDEVLLMLTQNHILLCENGLTKKNKHFLRLDFTVKFQILFNSQEKAGEKSRVDFTKPTGFRLEKQHCSQKLSYYSQQFSTINLWTNTLLGKINQKGFHRFFQRIRKIAASDKLFVYLCKRLSDNKLVAVKAFTKQLHYRSKLRKKALENEINIMRHINHKNLIKYQGVYQTENSIYVISQYVEGGELERVLQCNWIASAEQERQIMKNILEGLEYLGDKGIVHRDIKPNNILFRRSKSSELVICDFGLATYADAKKYIFFNCGTPGFVSPEIANINNSQSKIGPISDMFSAGLIFHILLFKRSIFSRNDVSGLMMQNKACNFDFTSTKYQKINPLILDLLKKMLEIDPSKRISAKQALSHEYFHLHSDKLKFEDQPKQLSSQKQSSNLLQRNEETQEVNETQSFLVKIWLRTYQIIKQSQYQVKHQKYKTLQCLENKNSYDVSKQRCITCQQEKSLSKPFSEKIFQ